VKCSQTPTRSPGCNPYNANHANLQWINTACFVAAPAGELGNAARVPVVGPDFVNTGFSVIKQFALPRKGMGLNFRAEFFNLFNHALFGMPVNDIGSWPSCARCNASTLCSSPMAINRPSTMVLMWRRYSLHV
jgi:hypothetical protein